MHCTLFATSSGISSSKASSRAMRISALFMEFRSRDFDKKRPQKVVLPPLHQQIHFLSFSGLRILLMRQTR
jgi:hypothetical protein